MTGLLIGLLLLALLIYLNRKQAGGGPAGMFGYGRSPAKLLSEDRNRATFADVAGIDEAKEELEEIVEFLRRPEVFSRLGGKIPKGALLIGPPGTGKTLLARAIAGEAGVPFFTISGSDFVQMFVGVGASRVRDMFTQAKKNAPCIVFIDEIDAVGRSRGVGIGGGNDEREQTLNQLLVEMDGFESNEGVVIIAATNRPDVLDQALLRPGRFDRQVVVPVPDLKGREKILQVHARKIRLGPDVDLRRIARGTPGFSGADLANLVNEAALLAARIRRQAVSMEEFENAKDKVILGSERRSMVMTEEDRRRIAYHEAGHALVGINVPQHDPINKATIIPRGMALGVVHSMPERDEVSITFTKYQSKIAMAMGGSAAEELMFGSTNVSSGAASDIKQATRIARAMVTQFGMSEKLGKIDYSGGQDSQPGLPQGDVSSPETRELIDSEIRRIVDEGYKKAMSILVERKVQLERLAEGLLEFETLTGEEIGRIVDGGDKPQKTRDQPVSNAIPFPRRPSTMIPKSGRHPDGQSDKDPGMGVT